MKTLALSAAVVVGLAASVQASSVFDDYTSFYSFGDSLTYDGRFGPALPLLPPSFEGRFTTDLTWSEYIEDDFKAADKDGLNFALGGATAGDTNLRTPDSPLGTFGKQIDAFQTGLPFLTPGDNSLISVWFGANDLFLMQNAAAAADAVANGIRTLADTAGQSFDNFLVFQLPDLGATPAYSTSLEASQAGTFLTNAFNTQLTSNILDLTAEGLNITSYDPQMAFDLLVSNPGDYGLTETRFPCTLDMSATVEPGETPPPVCTTPSTFLFSDSVHPNGAAHLLVSQQVEAAFMTPIPVPAGLPLMLGGLCVFGAMRRRRKAA